MLGIQTEKQGIFSCDALTIASRPVGDVLVLDLIGKITIDNGAISLVKTIKAQVSEERYSFFLLNFEKVVYIDNSGIGALVDSFNICRKKGGKLKLVHLIQKIEDLLAITKLLTVFDNFHDESEALASFGRD